MMRRRRGDGDAQPLEELRRRRPLADQPMRDVRDGNRGRLGQCAIHELARGADAKRAGDELAEDEALVAVETLPRGHEPRLHLVARQSGERSQVPLDPRREVGGIRRDRRRQQQCNGLREVADRFVAGFEQPGRHACGIDRSLAQIAAADQSLQLAPGEEVHRPGDIVRRRAAEIAGERGDLCARARRRVERHEQRGEAAHAERVSGAA